MTPLSRLAPPETLPPNPTPPGRSSGDLPPQRCEGKCDVDSLARARELLCVIKALVERLEEHLDELS
jgi:hypothetical protein